MRLATLSAATSVVMRRAGGTCKKANVVIRNLVAVCVLATNANLPAMAGEAVPMSVPQRDSSLYVDSDIAPAEDWTGCIEVNASIVEYRFYCGVGEIPIDDAGRARQARIGRMMGRLPPADIAAQQLTAAIRARVADPLSHFAMKGRLAGPQCMASLNFKKHSLAVVTLEISNRYVCKDDGGCWLDVAIAHAVCHQQSCRARSGGTVQASINPDSFDPKFTHLQGLASQVLNAALARLGSR